MHYVSVLSEMNSSSCLPDTMEALLLQDLPHAQNSLGRLKQG
jgi:hypothetical protein